MASNSEKEFEVTVKSYDNESKAFSKEFGKVRGNGRADSDRDPSESNAESSVIGGDQSKSDENLDFIADGRHSQTSHSRSEPGLLGNHLGLDMNKVKEEYALVDKTQEGFEHDRTLKDDKILMENKRSSTDPSQKAIEEFRDKLLEEDQVLSESLTRVGSPTDRSDLVDFESKNACQLKCEQDPKEKALRYLEESGVLRMFQVG